MPPTRDDIEAATAQLAASQRGRRAMHALLDWIDQHGTGLDDRNQQAVLTLLAGTWGPLTGTARELIAAKLGVEQ